MNTSWPYGHPDLHKIAAYRGWRTRRRRLAGELTLEQRAEAAQHAERAKSAERQAADYLSFISGRLRGAKDEQAFRNLRLTDPKEYWAQRSLMPRQSFQVPLELQKQLADAEHGAAIGASITFDSSPLAMMSDAKLADEVKRLRHEVVVAKRAYVDCVRQTKWFTSIKGEE